LFAEWPLLALPIRIAYDRFLVLLAAQKADLERVLWVEVV
jgi:hypothetical protein